jgi:hypothetical protein
MQTFRNIRTYIGTGNEFGHKQRRQVCPTRQNAEQQQDRMPNSNETECRTTTSQNAEQCKGTVETFQKLTAAAALVGGRA